MFRKKHKSDEPSSPSTLEVVAAIANELKRRREPSYDGRNYVPNVLDLKLIPMNAAEAETWKAFLSPARLEQQLRRALAEEGYEIFDDMRIAVIVARPNSALPADRRVEVATRFEEATDRAAGKPPQPATAPTESRPRLVMVEGADVGMEFPMTGFVVGIGRDADSNAVVLRADKKISRRHAVIEQRESDGQVQYVLRDNQSRNHVFVNGQRVETRELANGDLVRVGDTVLQFVLK